MLSAYRKFGAKLILLTVAAVGVLFAAGAVFSADVRIDYVYDTSMNCANGSAPSNCVVTGFRFEQSIAETGSAWIQVATANATARSVVVSNVLPGRRCFRAIADAGTTPSAPTNAACVDVPTNAPHGFSITLTLVVSPSGQVQVAPTVQASP